MGFWNDLKTIFNNLLTLPEFYSSGARERLDRYSLERDYYEGDHRYPLKVRDGQPNDNVRLNYSGLAIDRSLAMLFGDGIEFDLPGEPSEEGTDQPNQQYIDNVWDANHKEILLQKVGQFGGMHGTCYIKIVPAAVVAKDGKTMLPRLVALDPAYISIDTLPEDVDTVLRYSITYQVEYGGKPVNKKEVTERRYIALNDQGKEAQIGEDVVGMQEAGWDIIDYIQDTGGKWREVNRVAWVYEFAPIIHWQNLPLAGVVQGKPDVTPDVIELQDRLNFVASNINKIIRYHAHPKTWGVNAGTSNKQSWGADEMVLFGSPDAKLANLEMQSDLASSREFLLGLRQSLFDITRTVDITSLADKLGALTNFGLHVLFMDALNKNKSKQSLYGEALVEINHRLLVLAGTFDDTDGGEIVWPDPLPENESEVVTGLTFDLNNGLCSKETAATERGYDFEEEQKRIDAQTEVEAERNDNVGSNILRAFDRNGGMNFGGANANNRQQGRPLAR